MGGASEEAWIVTLVLGDGVPEIFEALPRPIQQDASRLLRLLLTAENVSYSPARLDEGLPLLLSRRIPILLPSQFLPSAAFRDHPGTDAPGLGPTEPTRFLWVTGRDSVKCQIVCWQGHFHYQGPIAILLDLLLDFS